MPRYSTERKQAVLDKLLPPHNLSVNEVARQEGISVAALYNWRRTAKQEGRPVPGNRKLTPEDWPAQDKFAVVIETASLNSEELGAYCRSKGLYPEQIERWKAAFISSMDQQSSKVPPSQLIHRKIRKLEREVQRKDKALAEAAALLVLQKKFQTLWEDEEN